MYRNHSISTRRRNYWRHDVTRNGRTVGHLVSTPFGYMLHSTDHRLRWLRARYYRTPAHLIDQARLIRLRAEP